MMWRNALLAGAVLALPLAAKAQPVTGPYVHLGAGYNWMQDWDVKSVTGPAGTLATGEHMNAGGGVAAVGSVGYGFGNGLRVEVEGDFRQSHHSLSAPLNGGDVKTYGGMANVLYDFDIGQSWIYPYVGAGVGYQVTNVDRISATVAGVTGSVSGSEGGLGAQGIIGAGIPIPSVPGLSVTAEYRFLGIFSEESFGGSVTPPGAAISVKMGHQYNHAGMLGLSYAFGVAPPPPPSAAPVPVATPAPAPARTYLVFFDWDKADLTARARQIIADAAQASTHVNTTQIEVDGHADLSGTPQYNQKLSLRRAQAVGAELVKDGVPQNIILIRAFGDTRPLVPTARGVREPQNRRVEIILK